MDRPAVDLIPDSAIQKSGKPFFLPDFAETFRFKITTAIHICRLGKNIATKFAPRYYDMAGLCISSEALPTISDLQASGAPWSLATAFDGSVIVGNFRPIEECQLGKSDIRLNINGITTESLVTPTSYEFDKQIAYVSRYFTLKIGDYLLIDSGDWHTLNINDKITASLGEQESVNLKIK